MNTSLAALGMLWYGFDGAWIFLSLVSHSTWGFGNFFHVTDVY